MFRTGVFEKLLEKATSNMLLEPDWPSILQICDLIRQNDVTPKHALLSIKKKLYSTNPHSALYALQLLESMVKNCGPSVHEELSTKAYCDVLHELATTTQHEDVRQKLLELIQTWTFAFRKNPKYSALKDTMTAMKGEGYKFPALRETDAMFSADTAPEWLDGSVCHRCRTQFALLVRKHHCRACGQVFCSACTQKTTTLPKFGIEKEVRVCDNCYDQVTKPTTAAKVASDKTETELPPEYLNSSLAQQNQAPPRKTEEEIREEEELQLALALSQSEAEAKEHEKMRVTSAYHPTFKVAETKQPEKSPSPPPESANPELARYLNRTYWENRQTDVTDPGRPTSPSAPATAPQQNAEPKMKENGIVDVELEDFVSTLKSQVEIFINRMKSNSSRGRSIAVDSSVQTIFMNITAMHSRLLRYIQQHDDSRLHYERLQDKLTQVKDARAALDALREEHREKLRRQAEEAERQRQMQMAHKLDIMRKKKQEYLQYQRQLALQRIQEQEREMQMRQEQQKQQYIMGPQFGPYMGSPVHGQQFPPPPNSAPVGMYYPYGQPMIQGGQPMMQGPPQSAPQMSMGGPGQGIPSMPPGFPPQGQGPPQTIHTPGQPPQGAIPQMGVQQHNPPGLPQGMPSQGMQSQGMPPQGMPPQGMPPQGMQSQGMQSQGLPPPGMGPPPHSMGPMSANSQTMMGQPLPNQHPQQQFQQPGAPPASPHTKQEQNGETQTAELISFD